MSYSPDTGLVYIPAKQEPFPYVLDEDYEVKPIGMNLGLNFWDPPTEAIPLDPEFGDMYQGFPAGVEPVHAGRGLARAACRRYGKRRPCCLRQATWCFRATRTTRLSRSTQ